MDITQKTPGVLIDELVTTRIKWWLLEEKATVKVLSGEETETRVSLDDRAFDLCQAIDELVGLIELGEAIDGLIVTDIKCFFAQEELFECDKSDDKVGAGEAAMKVHRLNASRSNWLRTIDKILGFGEVTLTKKTYDEIREKLDN